MIFSNKLGFILETSLFLYKAGQIKEGNEPSAAIEIAMTPAETTRIIVRLNLGSKTAPKKVPEIRINPVMMAATYGLAPNPASLQVKHMTV
jgi:hypothetical protein